MHTKKPKGSSPENWIDFRELREKLDFGAVLAVYGVELHATDRKGQARVACPLPGHAERRERKTFSANLSKGIFRCFGCGESGNAIDFAVLMAGLEKGNGSHVRQAALELRERFIKGVSVRKSEPECPRVVNAPLGFELKTLDPSHAWFAKNSLTRETVGHFGLGYCSRGALKGKIAIPIHDDSKTLIGYAGLPTDEEIARTESSQYVYPEDRKVQEAVQGFDRSRVLYHGHEIARSVNRLYVSTQCHEAWWLWQCGFRNVVALMNEAYSPDQAEQVLLLTTPDSEIRFLHAGEPLPPEGMKEMIVAVARNRRCRWLNFRVGEAPITGLP